MRVPRGQLEDEVLLDHEYGIADIAKAPRELGREPSGDEHSEGSARIRTLARRLRPHVLLFVYRGTLDRAIRHGRGLASRSAYGFSKELDALFGSAVFVFPMPGTPCTKETAGRVMRELRGALDAYGRARPPQIRVPATPSGPPRLRRPPDIDADTIEVEELGKVRYVGVDAPWTKYPRRPVERMAKEAYGANRKLVEGKRVSLEVDAGKRDRYGRVLAYVRVGTTFVNAWLVVASYARVMTIPPSVTYKGRRDEKVPVLEVGAPHDATSANSEIISVNSWMQDGQPTSEASSQKAR